MKEHERARYYFDPTVFYENRFWNRRQDGIVIHKDHRTPYILEVKQSSDRNQDFVGVKEDEANVQHKKLSRSRRSKRLPRNGLLNGLILWQGGVVQ